MPLEPRPPRPAKKKLHSSSHERMTMSQEELDELNKDRPPRDQMKVAKRCGARLSDRQLDQDDPAKNKDRNDGKCSMPAGFGTDHLGYGTCKFHAGNTPSQKKAAAREAGRDMIKEAFEKFGGDRTDIAVTPEEALLEEVRRSVAMVRFLEARIGTWSVLPLEDVGATIRDPRFKDAETVQDIIEMGGLPALTDVTFKGTPTETDKAAWLLLYREERQHMARVAKMTIDAGIAHRMVRVAEQQGEMLAVAIRAVLHALDLTQEQRSRVPTVVPAILRSVAMGETIEIRP